MFCAAVQLFKCTLRSLHAGIWKFWSEVITELFSKSTSRETRESLLVPAVGGQGKIPYPFSLLLRGVLVALNN